MIRIDNISFGFTAVDEQFAHELYANWDNFCYTCVEKVIEECLSVYDKEKILHEIELLDLDLGGIREEDFYQEFPRRLRDELRKALPLLSISVENREKNTSISRLENLLFYLEYGYLKIEWSDEGFNLAEELEWIAKQSSTYINNISKLCLNKEHALRRLLWQADDETVLLSLYVAALSEPAASLYEKRSFLVMLLEVKPDIPVRFIHEAESDAGLLGMAELLDTVSVHRIMEAESKEHTEVDLPPYWHYLYEWLIQYYPFNGLAIFGSKGDFISHLHHRLLTFIRKRSHAFYFSKVELTLGFLLEVFGPIYYIEVLNAIYNLQPHHPDGSPVHDNYYNRELYRLFLSLSLLRSPFAEEGKEMSVSEKADNRYPLNLSDLTAFLKDTQRSDTDKQRQLALYLGQYTENYANAILLLHKENLLLYVIRLISWPALEEIMRQSAVRIGGEYWATGLLALFHSLVVKEPVVSVYLHDRTTELKVQLLTWLASTIQPHTNVERTVAGSFHFLLTALFGKENIYPVIARISREIDSNIVLTLLENYWNVEDNFICWLEDKEVYPDNKRELLQKMVVEKPLYWIQLLRKQPRESKVVPLLSAYLSVPLLLQSMALVDSRQASVLSQTVEWIQNKINDFPFLTGGNIVFSTVLSQALLLYMQDAETLGGRTLTEQDTIHKFLSYLHFVYTGKYNYQENTEWATLSGRITIEPPLEQVEEKPLSCLMKNDIGALPIEEISNSNQPESIRKKLLYWYIRFQPEELLDYVSLSITRNILPLDKWLVLLDSDDWMRLITNLSLSQAELLQQIIDYLSEGALANKTDLQQALATYLIKDAKKWIYNSKEEAIRSFVQSLPTLQEKTEIEKKETEHIVKQILNIMEGRSYLNEEQTEAPESFLIANAGLCLFSPWLPRLFSMLGYLNEDTRTFKDTASQVHAVFLLQYLTCLEEKRYQETELVFNRLIVDLPMHIPLPSMLELTDQEKDVAESLVKAIKANWSKMAHTSTRGLQEAFILRRGRLKQQEEKWVLTVEDKPIDLLLESIPWSFKLMHYPWLKKYIQVIWYEK